MRPRFHVGMALVALFGIVTTHSLRDFDLLNLSEEEKTAPVPVKLHDEVRLSCGNSDSARWVRSDDSDVEFYNLGRKPYKIPNFTVKDNGNYQCRVETNEHRKWSNIVLCEAADDLSKCKIKGQTYRHLIKYGPREQIKLSDVDLKIRFGSLGSPMFYRMTVPMEKDVELDCGDVTSREQLFFWFVTWKSEWLDLEEYALSSTSLTKLIPLHRGQYECITRSNNRLLYHTFHVTFEDALLAPTYIGESPLRELSGLLHANVTIRCDITKFNRTNMTWVKSDWCPNTDTKMYKRKIVKTSSAFDAGILEITNVSSTDEACYTCFNNNTRECNFQSHRLEITRAALDAEHGAFSLELMVTIPCVVFLSLVVVGATIFYLRRSKRRLRLRRFTSSQPRIIIDLENHSTTVLSLNDEEEVSPSAQICSESDIGSTKEFDLKTHKNTQYSPWELRPDNLNLGAVLGENDFSTLYLAWLVNVLSEGSMKVVVKMSKAGTSDKDVLALVSEMEIMKFVGRHVNVVGLLGTCTQTDALFFAMEFAEHGNLREYLRKRGSSLGYACISESESENERLSVHIDLVSSAHQVAMGMNYLASKRCIHRDLRAKRVLISEGGILKIADYATNRIRRMDTKALARDNNLLHVRWMAPETFRGIHTIESNVWSYGILLWEIMTFAETPYPLILENAELISRLEHGHCMDSPDCCPEDICKLMRKCWDKNPGKRPRFDQVVEDLDGMLKNLLDQLKRLEADNYEQEEYANPTCEPVSKHNYDSEYADVVDAIDAKI